MTIFVIIVCLLIPCDHFSDPPEEPQITEQEFYDKCERACGGG